jgi:uncharacterized protein (DUF1330 family)
MTAVYMMMSHNVTDLEGLRKYVALNVPMFTPDVEVLSVDASATTLLGEPRSRFVLLKFGSEESALTFWNSDAYKAIKHLREDATSDSLLVLGKAGIDTTGIQDSGTQSSRENSDN